MVKGVELPVGLLGQDHRQVVVREERADVDFKGGLIAPDRILDVAIALLYYSKVIKYANLVVEFAFELGEGLDCLAPSVQLLKCHRVVRVSLFEGG